MAKTATKAKSPTVGKVITLDLDQIVSNTAQSRGMGVAPILAERGYGIFEKIAPEKLPIWESLLSTNPDVQAEAATLIEESAPHIVTKADSIAEHGQLEAIGVVKDGDSYDIVFGMERALGIAFNFAKGRGESTVEAKVFEGDFSPVELKLLSFTENDSTDPESPIDRAITYKWLMKAGKLTPKALAERIGYSQQHVTDYLKLTDSKIEDLRMKIHTRKMSVSRALKLLQKRKRTGDEQAQEDRLKQEKDRRRLPATKTVERYYTGHFGDMDADEKALWLDQGVRRLLAFKLAREYTPEPEVKEVPKTETNGKAPAAEKTKVLKVTRERANQLLICLGKTAARTWSDEVILEALDGISKFMEKPDQDVEDDGLQKLLTKLLKANESGTKVKLDKDK